MIDRIEVSSLNNFLILAEELNFSVAAERLTITQPVLSRKIKRLEKKIGVDLFYRTKPQIKLTEAGKIFLEETRQIIQKLDDAIETAKRVDRGEIGSIKIGFESFLSLDFANFAPVLVKTYRERFPDVHVTIERLSTIKQVQAIENGEMEIGFTIAPPNQETLIQETVFREPLVLALSENHPLALQPTLDVDMLANEPFIIDAGFCPQGLEKPQSGLYSTIMKVCHNAGFKPQISQVTNDLNLTLGFVAVGMGVAILPAAVQYFSQPGIVYRSFNPSIPEIEIFMVWRKDNPSPVVKSFLDVATQFSFQAYTCQF